MDATTEDFFPLEITIAPAKNCFGRDIPNALLMTVDIGNPFADPNEFSFAEFSLN